MTTIAANLECMAADRKVTLGETRYMSRKLKRVRDTIVGGAGSSTGIAKFMRWFEAGADADDTPKLAKDEEIDVLLLSPRGLSFFNGEFVEDLMEDAFFALGTGNQAALAAMHLGLSPGDAVEVAKKVDNGTDGVVDVMWLDGRTIA